MKKNLFFLLSILALLVILFICVLAVFKARTFTNELEMLDEADKIELTVYQISNDGMPGEMRFRRVIEDPEQVDLITQTIRAFSDNWQYEKFSPPWTGVAGRVTPVEITFYRNGKFETSLRIGYSKDISYFLQQSPGPGRYLEYQEFKELMDFLGIDEKFAYYSLD